MTLYHITKKSGVMFTMESDLSPKDMYAHELNKGHGLRTLKVLLQKQWAEVHPDGSFGEWQYYK